MSGRANLELNIDRLVLHGLSPAGRRRLAESLESELQRLFASEGIEAAPRGPLGGIDLGAQSLEIEAGLGPEEIGAQVARAVWASSRRAVEPGLAMTETHDLAVPVPGAESTETKKGNQR
ncbi:MAG: hypothetical protein GY719_14360 [bacterium]|nr:hypothetical protein [bacterium]